MSNSYKAQNGLSPDDEVTLSFQGKPVKDHKTPMSHFNGYADQYIVFSATLGPPPNVPEHPSASDQSSQRQPLRPVSRQLNGSTESGTPQTDSSKATKTFSNSTGSAPNDRTAEPGNLLSPSNRKQQHALRPSPHQPKKSTPQERVTSPSPTPRPSNPPLSKDQQHTFVDSHPKQRQGRFHTMMSVPPQPKTEPTDESGYGSASPPTVHHELPPASREYVSRTVDNPIEETQQEEEPSAHGAQLQELLNETVPERLEAAVQKAVTVLGEIEQSLRQLPTDADAQNWLAQLDELRKQAARTRTFVGVVGNTGAGKSSVINAMLDEERLVPTNCMRACTAVVTEMSYNDSKNESQRYRAEIEFIKPEEWRRELKMLFDEVFDGNGNMDRDAYNPDTEAGIAYAKIRAVYHKYTKEMLAASSVDKLMKVDTVQRILGTTKRINNRDCGSFYQRLQHYVDSKEKVELDKNGNKKTNPKREFEFWPLITVVKIYTKAEALATGVVIVDLPGVHDSNAARAAVAEGYMKQCSGLWIVAPINRAVDDKAAKNLLGSTFKRQLKYDGTYSAVTFICSKTDDISKMEAIDGLKLGSRMTDLDDRLHDIALKLRAARDRQKHIREKKADHQAAIDQVEDQLEQWEELIEKVEDGKDVFAPKVKTKKRKRFSKAPSKSHRKRGRLDSEEDDTDASNDLTDTEETELDTGDRDKPLTSEEVHDKVDELKKLKKEARRENSNLTEELKDVRKEIASLEEREGEVEVEQDIICIEGRNEYSRGAIRQDFAAGIKELDQELSLIHI